MRTEQFLQLLARCNLKPNARRTAIALGLSLRQLQRIAAGKAPVAKPVALLLIAYAKYGVPQPLWDPDRDKADFVAEAMQRLWR